jgi:hypothetical protein
LNSVLKLVKIRKEMFVPDTNVILCGGRFGSFAFAEALALCVGAKANVPNVRLAKIELKKMCGGENKKYRRVGNECRLSCCPVAIWSLCRWSPVKISVSFYVYSRLFGRCCVVC